MTGAAFQNSYSGRLRSGDLATSPIFQVQRERDEAIGASMLTRFLAVIVALAFATPATAWGPIGHRVTGAIADENLSGLARADVTPVSSSTLN